MPTMELYNTLGHKRRAHPTGLIIPFPIRVYREVTGGWGGGQEIDDIFSGLAAQMDDALAEVAGLAVVLVCRNQGLSRTRSSERAAPLAESATHAAKQDVEPMA